MGRLLAFISYAHEDGREFAGRLGDALRTLSPPVQPLIDLDSTRGHRFSPRLAKQIGSCDLLLFVVTPDSVESHLCQAELSYAVGIGKRVLPLVLDGDVESHVDLELEGRPPVDFTVWNDGWPELREALVRIDSPEARLESLEVQRAAFDRKASTAKGTTRQRYLRKVAEFDARIEEERRRQADPESSKRDVAEGIRRGLEQETAGEAAPVDRSGFPTVNEPPQLLPNQFLDRVHETRRLEDRLCDPSIRLVAIVGPNGIGKTAIVARLLDDLRSGSRDLPVDAFVYLPADGSRPIGPAILLEDLSKLVTDEVAAARLEDCLNDSKVALLDKLDVALEQLAGTRVVVVIDDAEELLDSGRRLRDHELDDLVKALLLRRDPHGVKIVLVTREAPAPLLREIPGNTDRIDVDKGLSRKDAETFLRNLDTGGIFDLGTASEELLEEARRLTDGNPRALELIYSVLDGDPETSLPKLLEELDRVPADEDILDHLVGRLFDRLDLDDRRVMQALAIYRRPVLPAAVDYLLQWYGKGFKSEPALRRLLDRRLIRQDGDRFYLPRSPDGERLLDGIPFGDPTDRDDDPPPLTRLALLHLAAEYFHKARRRRIERIGDLSAWFAEIDLRMRGQDYRRALRFIYELDTEYLIGWGQSDAVSAWREELIGKAGDAASELHNLSYLAYARRMHERLEEAKQLLEAARSRAKHPRHKRNRVRLLNELGFVHFENGEVGAAKRFHRQALRRARWQRMRLQEAKARAGLLLCAAETGKFDRARGQHVRAFAALAHVQDKEREVVEAGLLLEVGVIRFQLGHNMEALDLLGTGRELARRLNERELEGLILNAQAQVLIDGHPAQAIGPATEAVEIGARIRSPQLSREANMTLALANLCAGNLDAAREAANAAARYRRSRRVLAAFALQGIILYRRGDPEEARRAFQDAHFQAEILRKRERRNVQVLDMDGLALSGLALCGEPAGFGAAVRTYEAARRISREHGVVRQALRLLDELAREPDAPVELTAVRRAASGR